MKVKWVIGKLMDRRLSFINIMWEVFSRGTIQLLLFHPENLGNSYRRSMTTMRNSRSKEKKSWSLRAASQEDKITIFPFGFKGHWWSSDTKSQLDPDYIGDNMSFAVTSSRQKYVDLLLVSQMQGNVFTE